MDWQQEADRLTRLLGETAEDMIAIGQSLGIAEDDVEVGAIAAAVAALKARLAEAERQRDALRRPFLPLGLGRRARGAAPPGV